ncbi:MAG: tetratricopeptide repeat protein [Methylococcaceae bacterium]|nr:tetratricopeptide repeat protein [Methylococcaceae bacterium]
MWIVYLSLAVQIFFGIHAIKTGRPFVWVLVIILTSLIGCLAYVIIELAPEWWASRGGRQVKNAIGNKIDPEKNLKAAQKACEQVDSIQNLMKLAEQYVLLNRYNEARELYTKSMTGIYAEDPQIMLGLAKAELGVGNFEAVVNVLDKLKATNPTFKSPEGHLLYARALEGAGRIPEAIHEYEAMGNNYPTPEPACRLAQIYKAQGNQALADELFQSVVKRSLSASKLFNETNKEWVKLAKREVGGAR